MFNHNRNRNKNKIKQSDNITTEIDHIIISKKKMITTCLICGNQTGQQEGL
ncbi:MAG TPA: hypothetical protein VFG45_11185 [Candidatus Nitrosocosmicus sp.]|nr:hypothetical protein [Candidatus Nitrosocosmicus sp.]